MKISIPTDTSGIKDVGALGNLVSQVFDQVTRIFTNNVSLVDNCQTSLIEVTFAQANVNQAFSHGLRVIPNGYIQAGGDAAAQVYDGTMANTKSIIYLRSSVATTVRLLVF